MIFLCVDDERIARSELKYLLKQVDEKCVVYEASDIESAKELIVNTNVDALFLDVHLTDVTSLDFASWIQTNYPNLLIIFATAYQEYAFNAYQLQAIDYILKPFSLEDIQRVYKHIQEHLKTEKNHELNNSNKLSVWCGEKALILDQDSIIMVKSENRGLELITNANVYKSNLSLEALEKRLNPHHFFRVHRSYLVNINYIEEMIPWFNNTFALKMKLKNHEPIPISRLKVNDLKKRLNF